MILLPNLPFKVKSHSSNDGLTTKRRAVNEGSLLENYGKHRQGNSFLVYRCCSQLDSRSKPHDMTLRSVKKLANDVVWHFSSSELVEWLNSSHILPAWYVRVTRPDDPELPRGPWPALANLAQPRDGTSLGVAFVHLNSTVSVWHTGLFVVILLFYLVFSVFFSPFERFRRVLTVALTALERFTRVSTVALTALVRDLMSLLTLKVSPRQWWWNGAAFLQWYRRRFSSPDSEIPKAMNISWQERYGLIEVVPWRRD